MTKKERSDDPRLEDHIRFICPQDGELNRHDVFVLCNTCGRDETVYKDQMYLCPICLKKPSFQCAICKSKEVKMEIDKLFPKEHEKLPH